MIDNPLYFSRSERRLIIACGIFIIMAGFIPIREHNDPIKWQCLIEEHLMADTAMSDPQVQKITAQDTCKKRLLDSMDKHAWVSLGAKPWIADRIIKYRSKGGAIRSSDDLLKIYGIDSLWVYQIADCIIWRNEAGQTAENSRKIQKTSLDINTADSLAWVSIKGIGPVLASRIIKFRNRLGGFHSVDQLKEVYGLSDSTFQSIKSGLVLTTPPKSIMINVWSVKDLSAHLLISWRDAQTIVRYRDEHGSFQKADDLHNIVALDSQRVKRWLPYADFSTDSISGRHSTVPFNEGLHLIDH